MPQRTKTPPTAPSGVYLFTGEDEFRKRLSLDRLKKKLLGNNIDTFNCESFYGKENSAEEIICSLETLPLTGSRKLVILKEPESLTKEDKSKLANYFMVPHSGKSILVLLTKKISSRDDKFTSFISKQAKVIDFSNLQPDDISAWIVKELKARGKTISRRSARLICEASNQELGQASSMVEQISIFADEREKITDDDVAHFAATADFSEVSAFKFLDYINDRDTSRCLQILKSLLRSGSNPPKIIGLLSWHITRLIAVKRLLIKGIAKSSMLSYLNIGSYALNRLISQTENFTLKQLKGQLNTLLDTDLMLKRSGLKGEFLLEMLVVKWGRS